MTSFSGSSSSSPRLASLSVTHFSSSLPLLQILINDVSDVFTMRVAAEAIMPKPKIYTRPIPSCSSSINLKFCVNCLQSRTIVYCDGRRDITFITCPAHATNPDPTLNTEEYPRIREWLGDVGIAYAVQGNEYFIFNSLRLDGTSVNEPLGGGTPEKINQTYQMMKREERKHARGCLMTGEVEMVVSLGRVEEGKEAGIGEGNGEGLDTGAEKGRESRLARCLYFKRCGGVFKNVRGEVL